MRKLFLILAGLLPASVTIAQQLRPATSAQVYHEIARLKHLTKVLYLAAHPDDENTRMLAWLVNDQHIPTAYLSLTRGDGGQNILGSEQGAALGLIRTHELLEARKLDGAGQFFTRAIDFGFSKTSDETFKHWNEYTLTNDVVWVIRQYRPDVIIARFPPDSRAGHGQHAASAILAAKAFAAAGDKLQFTEQFQYFPPWQPKRLLWNTYRFSSTNTTSDDQFKLEVGHYSPLLGMGYGELAGISRSIHRSQGAGTPSVPGVQKEYFSHVAGDSVKTSLFDGIDKTWNRVGRPDIGKAVDEVLAGYDFTNPGKSLPALLALRKQIATVDDAFWREEKLRELDEAILHAAGVMAEATTRQPSTVAGMAVPFTLRVIARAEVPVELVSVQWPQEDTVINMKLAADSLYAFDHIAQIPVNQPVTEPYWMKEPAIGSEFTIPHDSLRGLPETPNTLIARVQVRVADQLYTLPVPMSYKKLDPTRGDVVEQLKVVPEVSLEHYSSLLVTQPDGSLKTSVRIHSHADIVGGTLTLYGNNKELLRIPGLRLSAGLDTTIPVTINTVRSGDALTEDYYIDAELSAGPRKFGSTLRTIRYDHLPTLQYLTPAVAKVVHNDWKVTVKKIGYIQGAGDYTVTLLRLAGLQVDELREADLLSPSRLKTYDAIITGVRAINTEKRMSYWMPMLMQYVHNGGTLVMQYNTLQDMSTTQLGPYPITLANKRVTEEDAEVTFLNPAHRLLNYPNKITAKDFEGWVQERGLYFPVQWDEQYQTLFAMNDKGEDPLRGSLLYTQYGKGHYVYTSLAFFRQLPAGNKGAIRLLMNLLSVGK